MIERIFMSNWLDNLPLTILLIVPAIVYLVKQYFKVETHEKSLPSPACSRLFLVYSFLSAVIKRNQRQTNLILCRFLQTVCGLCKIYEKERIFFIQLLRRRLVFIFKPETVEAILSSTTEIEKMDGYRMIRPWLGTGLITSGGNKWRYRRKLLTPAFHFRILDDFQPIFNEQSNILLSKLREHEADTFIDIVPFITSCTLDILLETAMGVSINSQSGKNREYVDAVQEIGNVCLMRIIRPWLYDDAMFKRSSLLKKLQHYLEIVHNFTRQVIKEKKEELLKGERINENDENNVDTYTKKRTAFLELLVKYHLKDPSFTEEDIREEVDTFMFAGHDTTAMAISFALWLVGLDDNVQRLVHEELDEIFMDDNEREITRNDLSRMKYLECVIKETLRLYPSVPMYAREMVNDFKIGDYILKKRSFVVVVAMELHRDPKSFPNPEKFDPERFFPENVAKRHPYAYVPFSAGARNCIGQRYALMEAKTTIANILRNFSVVSKDNRDKVRVFSNSVISNMDPVLVRFLPRNQR